MVPEDVRSGPGKLTLPPAAPRESRGRRGWWAALGLSDDPLRRLALALALSIAFHEIVASLWPAPSDPVRPVATLSEVVTIVRRTPPPTPVPTPRPSPTPPPATPRPHVSFAPRVVQRAPAPRLVAPRHRRLGGRAAPRIVHVKPHPKALVEAPAPLPVSVATSNGAGVASGGAGSGAGAGTGDSGLAGSGSGVTGAGTGSGGDAAAPCGSVSFDPVHTQTGRDGSQAVTVQMNVTLSDGREVSGTLGWHWHYPSVEANPFNSKNPDESIPLQLPPPGTDLSSLAGPIAYAVRHTDAGGLLAFEPCPKI